MNVESILPNILPMTEFAQAIARQLSQEGSGAAGLADALSDLLIVTRHSAECIREIQPYHCPPWG
jgi:hypothetical protein